MTVILDHYVVPDEKGTIEIRQVITIQITAKEARRMVRRWLEAEVGFMVIGTEPTLVVEEERAVWRVPAVLTASHVGHVGEVGHVDVNVETEEMYVDEELKESMLQNVSELVKTLPPFKIRKAEGEAAKYVVRDYKPTPRVISTKSPREVLEESRKQRALVS